MGAARTGAAALIESLLAHGVTRMFGVPGEETTDLMDAIHESDMDFVLCRHEQGAAFMASVYARITRRPAACLATLGPGATNLVTGVADAHQDHVPLIAITGQGARARLGRESHQIIDLTAQFEPVTKLSHTLRTADDIPARTADAWRVAVSEKPGAVHLSLPEDVASAQTSAPLLKANAPVHGLAPDGRIDFVADAISKAKRPLIVAGAGVLRSEAVEAVQSFVADHNIMLTTTFMSKGLLPQTSPQMLFSIGQPEEDVIDHAAKAADLIIALGFDPIEFEPGSLSDNGRIPVVSATLSATPISAGWEPVAEAVGDIGAALKSISERLDGKIWDDVSTFTATRSGMLAQLSRDTTGPASKGIAPGDLCAAISDTIGDADTVLSGVGLHKLWIARDVISTRPGQVLIANGLAGMGMALPGAVAAAQLVEEGGVLAVCGDGDFMMNVQEMETASRLGVNIAVMVWEDGGYGLIDEHQGGAHPGFSFTSPKWSHLARAFDWSCQAIREVDDIKPALQKAMAQDGPSLVTVRVDYAAGGGMPTRDIAV